MLEFPKPIMKMSELQKMGFPESYLKRAYGDKNQTFATKMNPALTKSPIIFDTAGFKIWWEKQIEAQVRSMPRRRGR